jgi:hypothetical protein
MAEDRAAVDAFYAKALSMGARDDGAPGLRPQYHPHYYGAFVIDPDGHNIEAMCHMPEEPRRRSSVRAAVGKTGAKWCDDRLPDLPRVLARGGTSNRVMLSGVWQHLDAEQRCRAMPVLAGLVAPAGLLIMSLRHGRRPIAPPESPGPGWRSHEAEARSDDTSFLAHLTSGVGVSRWRTVAGEGQVGVRVE